MSLIILTFTSPFVTPDEPCERSHWQCSEDNKTDDDDDDDDDDNSAVVTDNVTTASNVIRSSPKI